jgi:hypothetical protein
MVYPEQKDVAGNEDFSLRPYFSDKFYKLKNNSVGKNMADNGKDIGFVR